jgi:hypothetical protein
VDTERKSGQTERTQNLTATRQVSFIPPAYTYPSTLNRPMPDASLPHWPCHLEKNINTTLSSHHSHFIFHINPLKTDLTEGSKTSEKHNLTPGKYPKENIQYSKHGESLKSRILLHSLTVISGKCTAVPALNTNHYKGIHYIIRPFAAEQATSLPHNHRQYDDAFCAAPYYKPPTNSAYLLRGPCQKKCKQQNTKCTVKCYRPSV